MTKQRLFYIFSGRFPCEIAISYFAAKSAEVFTDAGVPTTILAPRRFKRAKEPAHIFYKTKENYTVTLLPTIDLFAVPVFKKIAHYVVVATFSLSTLIYLLIYARRDDIIYSNAHIPLLLLTFFFKNTFYEIHDFPEKKKAAWKNFFTRCRWLLITNKWKQKQLVENFGVNPRKIVYARNAVDLENIDIPQSKEEAREKLGLSQDEKLIVYTGHLFSWKGVDTLGVAAEYLPTTHIAIVGGKEPELGRFQERFKKNTNITTFGFRRHEEIPYWQRAADLLILPNTAKEDISKYYTSPMKLFEYMASRTPIVASNIPSITEVLTEKNGFLFEPDNPDNLAETIQTALANPEEAKKRALQARKDSEKYTWHKRAQTILSFIRS